MLQRDEVTNGRWLTWNNTPYNGRFMDMLRVAVLYVRYATTSIFRIS